MARKISSSRTVVALTAFVAMVLMVATGSTPANAASESFKPIREKARSLVFKPTAVSPSAVRRAHVRLRHRSGHTRRRSVGSLRVRRALAQGERLKVRKGVAARGGKLQIVTDPPEEPTPPAPEDPPPPPADCETASFGPQNMPGACWRPYSDESPFNGTLPASPPISSSSATTVARWMSFWANDISTFGPRFGVGGADTPGDWEHPIYYSQPSDPVFTIDCVEDWGTCDVEGMQVRIPDAARPAGGGDAHMAVIDQESGWEYDFWQVRSKPAGGGTLKVSWGGRARIDGDGSGSESTAGNFALAAGVIRPSELEAGLIDHALFMVVKCTNGTSVAPASDNPGRTCASMGLPNAGAPPMGARFFLDMSDSEIDALPQPAWKKTILRAIADYGLIVGDTGGGFIKIESSSSFTSFGQEDPWTRIARNVGLPSWTNPDTGKREYRFDLSDAVNWGGKLRMVEPCVSQGTC